MDDSSDPESLVTRLAAATNAHDLDALVDCFADDYLNETPAHPSQSFTGAEQVRRNWAQLFAGIPDLRALVLSTAVDGAVAWTEWELSGTRRDGAPQLMRGVIIFTVAEGRATSARFYLEPVELDGPDADAAAARVAAAGPRP
ncbi:nuclear transport factor 2 family protein [Lacisediminihabitans profunda]|uniref:Nuclear transport factor 2 family protein n=1 Tax=Lacisediminihabitans profunda TaxID=2594790 RepID=A0A5C8UIX8_9MICO|nr:nuclear transport factor 2 family protein [Lacisediminihabitans profunda]TXN28127.1 nuclear transport factor 2 family protein [Lacisediminihabitans profunda]